MLTNFYLLKSKFLHLPLIHFGANCRTNCTCSCCSGRSGKAETRSTLSRVWVKWDWAREWPTCIITHHLEGAPTIHEVQTAEKSRWTWENWNPHVIGQVNTWRCNLDKGDKRTAQDQNTNWYYAILWTNKLSLAFQDWKLWCLEEGILICKWKVVTYCQVWWPILEIGVQHLTHPSAHTQQWEVNTHWSSVQ